MKLRLPNKLVAAILAAASPVLFSTLSTATLGVAAVAAVAGHQAMGEDTWAYDSETKTTTRTDEKGNVTTYAGHVYTWVGKTTYMPSSRPSNTEGNFTYVADSEGNTVESKPWGASSTLGNVDVTKWFLANNGNNANNSDIITTLRFTAGVENKPQAFDFSPLNIAAVIVEKDAKGYKLYSDNNNGRNIVFGNNATGVVCLTTISEDFLLSTNNAYSSPSTTGGVLTLRGIQTWVVDEGKTFTLNSGAGLKTLESGAAIAMSGGGNVVFDGNGAFTNNGSINIAGGTKVTMKQSLFGSGSIVNAGTLQVNGSADIQSLTLEAGSMTALNGGGTLGTVVANGGSLELGANTTWQLTAPLSLGNGTLTLRGGIRLNMPPAAFSLAELDGHSFSEDDGHGHKDGYVIGDFRLATASSIVLDGQPAAGTLTVGDYAEGGKELILSLDGSEGGFYMVNWNVDYATGDKVTPGNHNAYGASRIYLTTPFSARNGQQSVLNLKSALENGVDIVSNGGVLNLEDGIVLNVSALNAVGTEKTTINSNGGTGALAVSGTYTGADTIFAKLNGDANVTVGDNATLNSGVSTELSGTLTVNNGARLTVGSGDSQVNSISSFSSVVLDNGTIFYENREDTLKNLTVAQNKTGTVASYDMGQASEGRKLTLAGNTQVNGTLTMNNHFNAQFAIEHLTGSGELKLMGMRGDNPAADNDSQEAASYTISSLAGFSGTLTVASTGVNATVNTGEAATSFSTLAVTHSQTANNQLGVVYNTQAASQISTVTVAAAGKLTLLGNEMLTVTTALQQTGAGVLNIGNGTEIGNVTLAGELTGTVNIKSGSTFTLGDGFSVTSGALQGDGYVNVLAKDTDTKTLSLHDGQDGYLTAAIDLSAYSGKLSFNNSKWKIDGVTVDSARFNNETYTLSSAAGNFFQVNTTVTKSELEGSIAGHDSTVMVGAGRFDLGSVPSGDAALPSGVTLGDATQWTGVVALSGYNGQQLKGTVLNGLGNANSFVELSQMRCWLPHPQGTTQYNTNLILENGEGTYAVRISGVSANDTQQFNGTIQGSGRWEFEAVASSTTYTFNNDISGWDGEFAAPETGSAQLNINLGAAANVVNVAISGGNNVITLAADTQFNNTVTAKYLSASGKHITLGSHTKADGTVTYGSLSLTERTQVGSLTINDGSSVISTAANSGATAALRGDVFVNGGGKLTLTHGDAMGWGTNGMGKLTLEGSSAEKLAIVQLNGDNVLSHGIEMKGNAQIIGDGNGNGLMQLDTGAPAGGGIITVSGTNNTISTKLGQRGQMTLNVVGAGSALDVTGSIVGPTWDDSHLGLIKDGEGRVTFRNDNNYFYGYTQNNGSTVIASAATFQAKNANENKPVSISAGSFVIDAANKAIALNTNVTLENSSFALTNGNVTLGTNNTFVATNSTIHIDGGWFKTGTNGLTIGAGSTLYLTNTGSGDSRLRGSVTVNDGGTMVITKHDSTGYNGNANTLQKITVDNGGKLLLGFTDATANGSQNETFAGTLVLNGTLDRAEGLALDYKPKFDLFHTSGSTTAYGKIEVSNNKHGVITDNVILNLRADNGNRTTISVGANATLTVNANVEGSSPLTLSGGGTLYLNGANSFGGNLTIDEGTTVVVGNDSALGTLNASSSRTITLNSGATLDVNDHEGSGVGYSVTLNGGILTNNRAATPSHNLSWGKRQFVTHLTLTADSTVKADRDKDFGIIGSQYAATSIALGSNTLEKTGAGTYYLTTTRITSAAGGKLKASEGVLEFRADGGDGSLSADIEMASGTVAGSISLGGNVAVTATEDNSIFSASVKVGSNTLTVGGTADMTMSGAVSGNGNVIKVGANVISLSGNNTYAGGTTVSEGTLKMAHANALGAGDITVAADGTLDINGFAVTHTLSLSGTVTNTGNAMYGDTNGLADVVLTGNATIAGVNSADAYHSVSVKKADGAASIDMAGHTLTVTNEKGIYFGETNITGGGTLAVQHDVVFYNTVNAGGTAESAGTVMQLESGANLFVNKSSSIGGLEGSGNLYLNSGAAADTTLTVNVASGAEHDSSAKLANNLNIAKTGEGTQTLSGSVNSFNGTIAVNSGKLAFTGLTAENAEGAANHLHISTATVSGSGTLKAGSAELKAQSSAVARTTPTGTLTNATFTSDSLQGGADGGTLAGGLLEIQQAVTYSISDMTLTDTAVLAENAAQLNVRNISLDAASGISAVAGSTLTGTNRLTLEDPRPATIGTNLASNQLSGLTMGSWSTLEITLNGEVSGLTNTKGFTITLSNFTWKDFLKVDGANYIVDGDTKTSYDYNRLNHDFIIMALVNGDTELTRLDVLSAEQRGNNLVLNVVPEPTTSALSLLALAGLAARRRRK